MQTNSRELVVCESKRRHNFTQNKHTGSDLGQMEIPGRDGATLTYSRWEDGCIYSEGSLHAAGHQFTDKFYVKWGWQICSWHCFSNHPTQPFITFPTCPPKSSFTTKFAQFCSYLPNHRHFMAWRPRGLLFCCMAGNCSALLAGVGWERRERSSSPPSLVPTALGGAHH